MLLEQTIAANEKDLARSHEAATAADREASELKREAADLKQQADNLAKQVFDLKSAQTMSTSTSTTSIIRSRPWQGHSASVSVPSIQSVAIIDNLKTQALTTAATGVETYSPSTKLRTRETEEIERLGKVIEAQKAIIEDQKERIKFWARVLHFPLQEYFQ